MSDGNVSLQIALRRIGEEAFAAGAMAMQNRITRLLIEHGENTLAAEVNLLPEPPYEMPN